MISHAQNAEDVVLARLLTSSTGFYVDVGAADPDVASVTRHFYDRGWSGVNIDPREDAVGRLRERRPRDVNLALAAGARAGSQTLFLVEDDRDLSTTSDDNVQSLRAEGRRLAPTSVEVRTLDSVLEELAPSSVDFVKIDVEGAEGDVLAGFDLSRWRPTVLVVEAVRPWSSERVDDDWYSAVEAQGYSEVLFDGLNLFFVTEQLKAEIGSVPPASVLDDYLPASVALLEEELTRLRSYIRSLEEDLGRHGTYLATVEDELQRHEVAAVELTEYARHLEGQLKQPDGEDGEVVEQSEPPRPVRVVVVSASAAARQSLVTGMAERTGVPAMAADHPGNVDFDELPGEFVLHLDWPPSQLLTRLLVEHRIDVVAVIESAVQDAASGVGRRGAEWATRPGTLTVPEDQLASDLSGSVDRLLEQLGVDEAVAAPPVRDEPDRLRGSQRGTKRRAPADPEASGTSSAAEATLRIAVVGTPRVGNTWIRRVLADALGLAEMPVHSPQDVDWSGLPHRVALQLHWSRTPELCELLDQHGVTVISPARHPLDVLLSVLVFANKESGTRNWLDGQGGDESSLVGRSATDQAFLDYATSPRAKALLAVTPEWWRAPETVRARYEDLTAGDPLAAYTDLIARAGLPVTDALEASVRANTPARLSELSGGVHVWRASAGAHQELLAPAVAHRLAVVHRDVFEELGYALPPGDGE
ncbi:FkbM family methyltransferase [Modestobacter lacusdianchii]